MEVVNTKKGPWLALYEVIKCLARKVFIYWWGLGSRSDLTLEACWRQFGCTSGRLFIYLQRHRIPEIDQVSFSDNPILSDTTCMVSLSCFKRTYPATPEWLKLLENWDMSVINTRPSVTCERPECTYRMLICNKIGWKITFH